ncbi:MAG: hypothetical protein ACRENQ_06255 [Gemmatimonadaceae bacterium]
MIGIVMVQGPRLSVADAGSITRLVAATVIPDSGRIAQRPVHGRTILFDAARTSGAFGGVASGVTPEAVALNRPVVRMPRAEAIRCNAAGRNCAVQQDGIFFSIDTVDHVGARSGELRVVASVNYTNHVRGGRTSVIGADVALYVALINYKWTFVRYGSAATG